MKTIKSKLKVKIIVKLFFVCLIVFNNVSVSANEKAITNKEPQIVSEDSIKNSIEILTEDNEIQSINIKSLVIEGNGYV